ncbi:neuroblast differentiation-associated protein AHNAK-like isoform X2 [Anguilla rostrata]
MRHSRSKSFSDSLVLEDVDKGGVIVKSIRADSSTDIGLKEGDEIIGATIHFDKLKKDEVLRVLKLIEPYDENMKVLTKESLKASVSSGILNNSIASPKEMLEDSYSRLFHSKVQRFLNREPFVCDAAKTSDVKIGDLNSQLLVQGTRLHLDGPSFKSDIAGPSQNLSNMIAQTPQVDIDAKWSGPKIQDTKALEDSSFSVPDFSKSCPMPPMGLSSKLKEPDLEDNVKCLEVNLSGPNSESSDMDLNMKIDSIKGGDNVSGIDILDDSTHRPELDLKATDVDLKSPSKKCTYQTLPKFGMSGPNVKGPEMDIDGDQETPGLNCSSPKILKENNTPQFGVDLPKADLNSPKFSLSGPKVKGPDFGIDAGLKTPDLNLKAPKIKGGIKAPDIGLNLPNADIKGTGLNVDVPNVNLKSPSQKFKFPTLPKFGISGPKLKHPEMDIHGDLETPDMNLSPRTIKGEMNVPQLGADLPNADFNIPKLDMKTPDLAINAPSGKFAIPKFNLSGPKVKGPDFGIDAGLKTPDLNLKAPKIKGGIKAPDIGLNLPNADIKGTGLNVDVPNVNLKSPSQKFKFPTLPKFGISGPKLKHPEMDIHGDLETPDMNLSPPIIKGEMNVPQLGADLPNADFNIPKLDMKTPDLAINAPSGKFAIPKFSLSGPKVKGPDFGIDAGLKTPDLNLKAPKLKGGIKAPDIGLNLPNADIKGTGLNVDVPNVNLKSPSQKFKFPTLPKFGTSGPKVNCPEVDIDGDLETPNFNLSAPKIKGKISAPDLGVDLPKANFKSPKLDMKTSDLDIGAPSAKFTMPKLNLSGPKVKGPDFDIDAGLKTPDLNLKAHKIKGGIKAPDVGLNLPSDDIKGSKFHLKIPDVDLKTPSRQFKFPTLPKFGISGPKLKRTELDIDADLKTPDLNLSAPKIKGEMNAPELAVNLPKADLNSPKLGTKTPHLAINGPSGKFTMPKFSLSGPKVKGPEFGIDTGMKTPDLNLKAPKLKGGIRAPDIGLNLPSADVKGTGLNMNVPDIDLKSPSRHFKSPTLPNFGISGPKVKRPEMDIRGDLETPDLNLSAPKMKGKISASEFGADLPKADFNIPKRGMKMPDLDLDAPSGKFTMPKFSPSGPKVKGPDFDIDTSLKTPDLSLKAPKFKGGIRAPDIGLNLPSGDMKGTGLNMDVPDFDLKSPSLQFKSPTLPNFGISGPKAKRPEMDIRKDLETPDLDLSAPKIKGKINAPKFQINASEFGADLPKADFNIPKLGMKMPDLDIDAPSKKFTMPKFSPSGPKVKGPDFGIDTSLKTPDPNLTAPKIKGRIKTPEVDVDLPNGDMKGCEPDLKSSNFDLKSHMIKGEISSPDVIQSLPQTDIRESLNLNTPHLHLDALSGKLNVPTQKRPKYGPTELNMNRQQLDIDASSKMKSAINTSDKSDKSPKANLKGQVDIPKPNLKNPSVVEYANLRKGKGYNSPSTNIMCTPDIDLEVPGGTLKRSKVKLQKTLL